MNRIAELRKRAGLSQAEFGKMMGAAQNTVSNWEKGNREPDNDRLKIMSEYFGVTIDYLLGVSEEKHDAIPPLTTKDEKDIEKILQQTRSQLESQDGLMFDGDPASPEAIESILAAMEVGLRLAKENNKKYTPKKYRK